MSEYTAESLADVASYFRVLASDQRASVRWVSTTKGKNECLTKASVWEDAASILEKTTIMEAEKP